jgi:putative sporulation protein YtxC
MKGGTTVIFSISYTTRDLGNLVHLRSHLQMLAVERARQGNDVAYREHREGGRHFFLLGETKGRGRKEWIRSLAETLASFMCDCLEPEWIRSLIQRFYASGTAKERTRIEQEVLRLLDGSAWECARVVYGHRREKLAGQMAGYLQENPVLAVDGFARFRLQSYRQTLADCVKEAVNDHLLDLEYREFIQLLKRFVSLQPPGIRMVHVIHGGKERYRLLEEDGTPLVCNEQDTKDLPLSHEDRVVGTLLSLLPARVMIHSPAPDENMIRTLLQIFEGRAVVCSGCARCDMRFAFQREGLTVEEKTEYNT